MEISIKTKIIPQRGGAWLHENFWGGQIAENHKRKNKEHCRRTNFSVFFRENWPQRPKIDQQQTKKGSISSAIRISVPQAQNFGIFPIKITLNLVLLLDFNHFYEILGRGGVRGMFNLVPPIYARARKSP